MNEHQRDLIFAEQLQKEIPKQLKEFPNGLLGLIMLVIWLIRRLRNVEL